MGVLSGTYQNRRLEITFGMDRYTEFGRGRKYGKNSLGLHSQSFLFKHGRLCSILRYTPKITTENIDAASSCTIKH